MHPYPHTYAVTASGTDAGLVPLASEGLPTIDSAPPPQFDGPAGIWSPETLLVAAVADCFVLSFRAVARASSFPWERIECRVDGTLARVEGVTRFTAYHTQIRLIVAAGTDAAKAHKLLERAEQVCLVSNSLNGTRTLAADIIVSTG